MKVGDLVKNLQTPASEAPLLGLIVALGPRYRLRATHFYIVKWMGRYNGETSAASENEIEIVNEDR